MNSVKSNILIFKYQMLKPSCCKDIGMRKYEFVSRRSQLKLHSHQETSLYQICLVSINLRSKFKVLLRHIFDASFVQNS